ncbi:MAG: T9SS type A sorting domain-containing protein [Bacteroidetes bacterium]|nr:T9SS type A sorting domain-containing protein [Bacteroidota bacterium]
MKNFYLFLTLVLCSLNTSAQVVNIPDANFKQLLTSTLMLDTNGDGTLDSDVDTNNDGQIQTSEALAVTLFFLNDYVNQQGYSFPINNLTGLEAFTNVTELSINSISAASIDLTALIHLEKLYINHAFTLPNLNMTGLTNVKNLFSVQSDLSNFQFSSLPNLENIELENVTGFETNFASLPHLKNLSFTNCPLTSINLSAVPNLETLICTDNQLTSLDLSNLIHLKEVRAGSNHIMSINTTNLPQLEKLDVHFNSLNSLNVSALSNLKELDCSANNFISSLDVGSLIQLERLNCAANQISSLDVAGLINLIELNCSGNQIQTLAVGNLTSLDILNCSYNQQITLVNLNNLVNLHRLEIAGCQFSNIDLSPFVNLKYLDVSSNLFNTLNISQQTALEILNCSWLGMSSLDLSHNPLLSYLNCNNNLLTTLEIPDSVYHLQCTDNLFESLDLTNGQGYLYLDFSRNPNLRYINFKDNYTHGFPSFFADFCPNIQFVCANENDIPTAMSYLIGFGYNNVQVNSYCTFTPGGDYNTITGASAYDLNGNGCDPSDFLVPLIKMNINDGTQTGATFTNATGNYSFFTQAGNYTITPTLENPYFSVTPASTVVNFSNVNNITQTRNFCFAPNGVHPDVDVVFFPYTQVRPGFDVDFRIIIKNKGNQIQSGNIDLTFDDAVLDFLSASLPVDNQSVNHLVWNYSNLYPFESSVIHVQFNVNAPTETPPVNIGDVLSFTAVISPISGDETPDDNTFALNETAIGSYDPNDKTCLEGEHITPEMVGDYLHYVIRFQNTGTAPAEFVVVKDLLDTAVFDVNSLQLIASSHPMTTRITGNKAEFIFQNINLPAESADEPGSHGFVAFKIKTKNNLILGNAVKNKAEIYFDYNFPIITNQTTTTVSLLALDEFGRSKVSMTPNPVKNILNITANSNLHKVELLDIQGRVLESHSAAEHQTSLDLSGKVRGMYLVRVTSELGSSIQKIIKE